MTSASFKRQLAPALDLWVSEDLIEAAQARRLRAYYALDEAGVVAKRQFGALLLAFGAVIMGLGLITLVAANWDAIPHSVRALGGLTLMALLDVAGYSLWRQEATRRRGSALLLAGAMMIGANIGLMAQWFQVGGAGWGLFLGWSLGALAMALALQHGAIAALATVAMLGVLFSAPETSQWVYPWAFAGVFLPVAVWCRSRLAFQVALVGVLAATLALASWAGVAGVTLTIALDALALWALAVWHETHQARPVRGADALDSLWHVTSPRLIAVVGLVGILEWWSFRDIGQLLADSWRGLDGPAGVSLGAWGLVSLAAWAFTLPRRYHPPLHSGLGLVAAGLVGLMVVASHGLSVVLPANLLLGAATLALAWYGLTVAMRDWFWVGFLGFGLQVLARFLEYESDLVWKASVFMVWGLVIAAAGWWLDRRLAREGARPREARHA